MQVISRIPKLKGHTFSAAQEWFTSMQKAGLLFHPDDDPQDIVLIATNKAVFSTAEVTEVRGVMRQLFDSLGNLVYEACYPVIMESCKQAVACCLMADSGDVIR